MDTPFLCRPRHIGIGLGLGEGVDGELLAAEQVDSVPELNESQPP